MLNNAQRKFVIDIYNLCNSIGVAYNNICPIAVTAQACIESNYGRSTLSKNYHNYFGLKCGKNWKGKKASFKTKEEYKHGVLTTIVAEFRAYDSMEDGVKGYYEFVDTKRYANLKGVTNPTEYVRNIKEDGYATSYSYVSNVLNVVNQITPIVMRNKNLDEIAQEVIDGKWGNGENRKALLTMYGYDYDLVQEKVNAILKDKE
jgi:flagellum-specific peptidoglycan hydrolase FlgJ